MKMPNGKKVPRGLPTLIDSLTTGMIFYQQHPKACVVYSGIRYISRHMHTSVFQVRWLRTKRRARIGKFYQIVRRIAHVLLPGRVLCITGCASCQMVWLLNSPLSKSDCFVFRYIVVMLLR